MALSDADVQKQVRKRKIITLQILTEKEKKIIKVFISSKCSFRMSFANVLNVQTKKQCLLKSYKYL